MKQIYGKSERRSAIIRIIIYCFNCSPHADSHEDTL